MTIYYYNLQLFVNVQMNKILIASLLLVVSGCSSVDIYVKDPYYRYGDVKTRYGEKHIQYPNWENEAILRNARCRAGVDTVNNCY